MPDFIFRETGLADRLETFVPNHAKRVYFPDPKASAWIHRDPEQLERELRDKWGERGDVAGFRHDEARVVAFLQEGLSECDPAHSRQRRAIYWERIWCGSGSSGSAWDLLHHYFTADRTRIYMAMTVTESGPVSLREPYSAFTLPVMDSGSVFDGYYGFVKDGIWRVTEELDRINREIGVEVLLGARVEQVDSGSGTVRYSRAGETRRLSFDQLVFATDPLGAARLVGDSTLTREVEAKRFLGSSGKLTLLFQRPARWKEGTTAADGDTAFRFIFAVESLEAFERATLRPASDNVAYEPGYIQIYPEGAAMRQLGLTEPFDRLTLFFKNLALRPGGRGTAGGGRRREGPAVRSPGEPGGLCLEPAADPARPATTFPVSRWQPGPHHAGRGTDLLRSAVCGGSRAGLLPVRLLAEPRLLWRGVVPLWLDRRDAGLHVRPAAHATVE